MKKDKLVQVRISREQYEKFKKFAEIKDTSKSELIRGFIKRVIKKL